MKRAVIALVLYAGIAVAAIAQSCPKLTPVCSADGTQCCVRFCDGSTGCF
jgi:hypothetical protein